MKKVKIFLSVLVILVMITSLYAQQKSFKIVVNKSNSIESISTEELSKIFFKKKTLWNDGKKILPVNQVNENSVKGEFAAQVQNKSTEALNAYWRKKIFSGHGVPPVEKNNDLDVLEYIKQHPEAVGYLSADADVRGVKVITVTE